MTTVIDRPAVLGGTPIRARDYPAWPVWDEHERDNVLAVLEAGGWWQGDGDAASTFAGECAPSARPLCSEGARMVLSECCRRFPTPYFARALRHGGWRRAGGTVRTERFLDQVMTLVG